MDRHNADLRTTGAAALALVFTHASAFAQCGWSTRFGPPGGGGDGMNARVCDMVVLDDGSGLQGELIAGGEFTIAGSAAAPMRVATFNGTNWTAVGSGGATNGTVFGLTTYIGAPFGIVSPGSEVYAGGAFTTMDGVAANHVSVLAGGSWLPTLDMGTGVDGTDGDVTALVAYDLDGTGWLPPLLFVGGQFTQAGGNPANNVAVWSGANWGALGGLGSCVGGGTDARVDALCVFDDGSGAGPQLYVGGYFGNVDCNIPASLVARFDPFTWTWSAVGALAGTNVYDLTVFDDGSGPQLYAGGDLAGMNHVVKWNGSTWSTVGPGLDDEVRDLLVYQCGGEPQLIASGSFSASTSGSTCPLVGKWDGVNWIRADNLGIGLTTGVPLTALCMADYNDVDHPEDLYVGGAFLDAQNQPSNFIAATCACRQAPFPVINGEIAVTTMGLADSPYVLSLVDVRPALPAPDTNWDAPMFHNEFMPSNPSEVWNLDNLGQVFGVCYDGATPPNIYVAATSIYMVDTYGPAGAGGVYKIDGGSCHISTFLTTWPYSTLACVNSVCPDSKMLPNTGPALGDICYDRFHNVFFVSNMEDGKIYRLDTNGNVLQAFDPFVADDETAGYAPLGERVWALQVFNPRQLYFSRWNKDASNGGSTTDNEIWVLGIQGNGAMFGTPQRAVTLAPEPGQPFAMPCSDITFSPDNKRMLIAQRHMLTETDAWAHGSAVLEFIGGTMTNVTGWTRAGTNDFWLGDWNPYCNAAGGADYDCDLNVFATGDALKYQAPEYIYGLQRIPAGGNTSATATSTSQIHDMNRNTSVGNKTQIGDCEVFRRNCQSNHWIYGTAKINSQGCMPAMDATGLPHASANGGFEITCTNLLGNMTGLLFYGLNGPHASPFQGGTLLVTAPLKRTPVTNSGGTTFSCDGQISIDMNAYAASGVAPALLVPGTIVNCQVWSRDPMSVSTTSLSDGLEYFVEP